MPRFDDEDAFDYDGFSRDLDRQSLLDDDDGVGSLDDDDLALLAPPRLPRAAKPAAPRKTRRRKAA